jgi:hypothetical protein
MKIVRLLSSAFACAIAAAALAFAATAHAQVELDGQAHAKGEPVELRLGQYWYETEGNWRGSWSPMRPAARDGAFNASWTTGHESASATLQIQIAGGLVLITRTQPNGQHCHYRGTFNAAGNVVTGTYTCDWAHAAMPWRATIGVNVLPAHTDERPSFHNIAAYYFLSWNETEGAWRGQWTPHDPDHAPGRFDGHWAHERESAHADLQITVEEGTGHVRVQRLDPDGRTCNYVGQIGGDFLSISGQFRCSDQPRIVLSWGAHINVPQR